MGELTLQNKVIVDFITLTMDKLILTGKVFTQT